MSSPRRVAAVPEEPRTADGIDEGKRLIRAGGGDRGLSLADRVAERFHRLTWGTPLHAMRLRGRHPLKLIAVPDDPFLGDIKRGHALFEGIFSFRGEPVAFDDLAAGKPDCSRALAEHFHSFAWLRDLSSVATRAEAVPVAETLTRLWLETHADRIAEPAWRPDVVGRRILFWCAHAPLILSSTDLVYRSRVLNTLARGSRHLERNADKAPFGTPRLAAWCGVVAAGLLIPGGDARRGAAEAGLARAIAHSLFEDGGVVSRSGVAQLDAITLLTLVSAAYDARRLEPPPSVRDALPRAVAALLGLCHGDRGLSSWQGGAPLPETIVQQVIEGSGVRTRPLRQGRDWGYQRLASGRTVLVMDAAPPPVARLVEGGCASTLAIELSDGPERVIVSCGGARALVHGLAPALAEGLRTTAAHSTLVMGDSNSTAIHPDGTLGRGVGEVELARHENETLSRIEASHDGYARRFGLVHRRQIVMSADGRDLRGDDTLLPAGRKRRAGATPFAVRFHLAPHIDASPTADGQAALLRLGSGTMWQFRCRGGALSIEDSVWVDGTGRPVGTHQLVVSGEAPAGGAGVSWILRRAA